MQAVSRFALKLSLLMRSHPWVYGAMRGALVQRCQRNPREIPKAEQLGREGGPKGQGAKA